jgi:predicted RNA-binding protein associated with RNAse of E/G family
LIIESSLVVSNPRQISGKVIADSGYLAIWFIFKNKWYDVGKFYDRDRKWIGYYCDIVKPVARLLGSRARTTTLTDLFLDLWITPEGRYFALDEDELQNALERGRISSPLANQAQKQLATLIQMVEEHRFPPRAVRNIEPLAKD